MPFQKGNTYGRFKKGHPDFVPKASRLIGAKKTADKLRGRKFTPEQRERFRAYWESKKGKPSRPRTGKVISCEKCGKETYKYPRDLVRVKNSFCSKTCAYAFRNEGKTSENDRIRDSKEYKEWRMAVFKRDGFTCVICGIKNMKGLGYHVVFDADHIKPFSLFPELRFELSNGRTLCRPCHTKTDTWGNNIHKWKKEMGVL